MSYNDDIAIRGASGFPGRASLISPDIRRAERSAGRRLAIAQSLQHLANKSWMRGEAERAESLYRRAIAIMDDLLGAAHAETAFAMHGLASMLARGGRPEEAWEFEFRAMIALETALPPFHPRRLAAQHLWDELNAPEPS